MLNFKFFKTLTYISRNLNSIQFQYSLNPSFKYTERKNQTNSIFSSKFIYINLIVFIRKNSIPLKKG